MNDTRVEKPVEKGMRKKDRELFSMFASSALNGLCSNPAICPELPLGENKAGDLAQASLQIAKALMDLRLGGSAKQPRKAVAKNGARGKLAKPKAR